MKPTLLLLLLLFLFLLADRLVEQEGGGDDEEGGDGGGPKRADIGAVYQEMASVLVPRVIKRNATGEQFRCDVRTERSKEYETQGIYRLFVCARRAAKRRSECHATTASTNNETKRRSQKNETRKTTNGLGPNYETCRLLLLHAECSSSPPSWFSLTWG